MADGQIRMRWMPEVVLVVEGAARPAAAQADASPVQVVAASGSGDDTIAALAGKTTGRRIVVTADRELRQRSLAAGAAVAGPGWLLGLL
jgi:rRNA-processing protein FCF1